MPPTFSSSASSFWLSPVMPWSSASTSSCERICWFIVRLCRARPASLDDEVGEVDVVDRAHDRGFFLLLLFLGRLVGRRILVLVVELDAHRAHGFAVDFLGQ